MRALRLRGGCQLSAHFLTMSNPILINQRRKM